VPNPADVAALRDICQSLRKRSTRLVALSTMPGIAMGEAEAGVNSAGEMEKIIQTRFDEAATDGTSWEERKKPYPWPPLQRTGRLMAAAKNAVRFTYRINGTRWNIGRVTSAYARYVHDGTAIMAARPFFADPSEEELKPADKLAARIAIKVLKRMMR